VESLALPSLNRASFAGDKSRCAWGSPEVFAVACRRLVEH